MKRSTLIVTAMLLLIGAHDQVRTGFGDKGGCQAAACGPPTCRLSATGATVMSLDFTTAEVAGGRNGGCGPLLLEPVFLIVHQRASRSEPSLLVRRYRTIPRTA
jgi:hypothetical protein